MKEKVKKERTPEQIEQTRIKRKTTSLRNRILSGCKENGSRRYVLELECIELHPGIKTLTGLGNDVVIAVYKEAIKIHKESVK